MVGNPTLAQPGEYNNLLTDPLGHHLLVLADQLQLAAWTLSGKGYSTEGISGEAAELLLSGWSKGTNTTYQSAWKKWASWCMQRKVDPLSSFPRFPGKPVYYRMPTVQIYQHHTICCVHDSYSHRRSSHGSASVSVKEV